MPYRIIVSGIDNGKWVDICSFPSLTDKEGTEFQVCDTMSTIQYKKQLNEFCELKTDTEEVFFDPNKFSALRVRYYECETVNYNMN